MIIHCPACEQTHDTSRYTEDANFPCDQCGHIIDLSSFSSQGSDSKQPSAPPSDNAKLDIASELNPPPSEGSAEINTTRRLHAPQAQYNQLAEPSTTQADDDHPEPSEPSSTSKPTHHSPEASEQESESSAPSAKASQDGDAPSSQAQESQASPTPDANEDLPLVHEDDEEAPTRAALPVSEVPSFAKSSTDEEDLHASSPETGEEQTRVAPSLANSPNQEQESATHDVAETTPPATPAPRDPYALLSAEYAELLETEAAPPVERTVRMKSPLLAKREGSPVQGPSEASGNDSTSSESSGPERGDLNIDETLGADPLDAESLLGSEQIQSFEMQLEREPLDESFDESYEEESQEPIESTSIAANPLLMAQAYQATPSEIQIHSSDSYLDDPFGQEESTAVSRNPLMQIPPTEAAWVASNVPPHAASMSQIPVRMPPPGGGFTGGPGDTAFDAYPQIAYSMPPSQHDMQPYVPPAASMPHPQSGSYPPGSLPSPSGSYPPGALAQRPHTPAPLSVMPLSQTPSQAIPLASHDVNFTTAPNPPPQPIDIFDTPDTADDPSLMVPQTDGRAIAGVVLLFLVVLGPICLLLGSLSLQRIRQPNSLFRGKGLAWAAIIVGGLQTTAMVALIALFSFLPTNHPTLTFLVKTFQGLGPSPSMDYSKIPPHPPVLSRELALQVLQETLNRQGTQVQAKIPTLYVYQEKNTPYAYAHWRDPQFGGNQRSLLLYSTQKHWHVATLYVGKGYEVRCEQPSGETLSAATARKLIECFWRIRGRFSNVSIAHLYVSQHPGTQRAIAYWNLTKQTPGKPIQQWKIKSLFHRSQAGQWYISRYAQRIPTDEQFATSTKGISSLDAQTARNLLTEYSKDLQRPFSPSHFAVFQAPQAIVAHAHWQQGRQTQRALFRYSNDQRWILARPDIQPSYLLQYKAQEGPKLSQTTAKKLILRFMRNNARRLLTTQFAKAGSKKNPPQRLPKLERLYIYQPPKQSTAYVRWQATFPKKILFIESLFHRAQDEHWYLSQFSTENQYDLRFYRPEGTRLSANLAKEMVLQLWREDEQSEKFNGAQIEDLYIYQPPNHNQAWAHWRKKQSDQITRMRTLFCRSNQGVWYLTTYDLGLGFELHAHAPGPLQLPLPLATSILHKQLKRKPRRQHAAILSPYVFQMPDQHFAFVRWILSNQGSQREMNSLLHYSNQGQWFLSGLESHHAPPFAPK